MLVSTQTFADWMSTISSNPSLGYRKTKELNTESSINHTTKNNCKNFNLDLYLAGLPGLSGLGSKWNVVVTPVTPLFPWIHLNLLGWLARKPHFLSYYSQSSKHSALRKLNLERIMYSQISIQHHKVNMIKSQKNTVLGKVVPSSTALHISWFNNLFGFGLSLKQVMSYLPERDGPCNFFEPPTLKPLILYFVQNKYFVIFT